MSIILSVILLMLLVSCSLKLAKHQPTDYYGSLSSQKIITDNIGHTPQTLNRLIAPAKLLADTRLALDDDSPFLAEHYLDTVLHEFGIESRPGLGFWRVMSNNEYQQNAKEISASLIKQIADAGYNYFAIAKSTNEHNTTVAIIAIKQSFYFDVKIPKQVKRLQTIHLKGHCSEDASYLSLLIMSPDKHIASEPLYCLDQTFSLSFSLDKTGRYQFELLNQSPIDALARPVLDFYIDVEVAKSAATIPKPAALGKMHFKAALLKAINHERHTRKLGALTYQNNLRSKHMQSLKNDISLEYLPESKNGNVCIVYKSFASNLDSLFAQSLNSLAYSKYAYSHKAVSYGSVIKACNNNWQMTQIICGKQLAGSMWIGRYRGINKRLRYLAVRRSKLLARLGFILAESNQQMLKRWLLAESLKSIRYLEGLNGFIKQSEIKDEETVSMLDEAFVTIWENMHNDKLGNPDNIREALILPLMQLAIHQYPDSCKTNKCINDLIARFSKMFNLDNKLSKARQQILLDYLNLKSRLHK